MDAGIAADVWEKFASDPAVANLPAKLDQIAKSFETETAPDAALVDEDIRELKKSAEGLLTLYKDLANSFEDTMMRSWSSEDNWEIYWLISERISLERSQKPSC